MCFIVENIAHDPLTNTFVCLSVDDKKLAVGSYIKMRRSVWLHTMLPDKPIDKLCKLGCACKASSLELPSYKDTEDLVSKFAIQMMRN